MKYELCILVLLGITFRSKGSATEVDPYSMANINEVTLLHYNLTLTLDFTNQQLSGEVEYVFESKIPKLPKVILDIGELNIESIRDGKGENIPFTTSPPASNKNRRATINLPTPPAAANTEFKVYLTYKSTYTQESTTREGGHWVNSTTLVWKRGGRSLLPCVDSLGVHSTYMLRVRPLSGMHIVASAPLLGDWFVAGSPVSVRNLGFVVGDVKYGRVGDLVEVWALSGGQLDHLLYSLHSLLDYILELAKITGLPILSSTPIRIVALPGLYSFPGFTTGTMIGVSAANLPTPKELDPNYPLALGLSRILFGTFLSPSTDQDLWVTEGLAAYFALQVVQQLHGEGVADDILYLEWRQMLYNLDLLEYSANNTKLLPDILPQAPAQVREPPPLQLVSQKAYLVLQHIAGLIGGGEIMDKMLRAFSASYYTQSITTQDFELFVTNYLGAHAHGGSNSIQWENLLETTGLPLFTVRPYTKKGVQTMHQLALATINNMRTESEIGFDISFFRDLLQPARLIFIEEFLLFVDLVPKIQLRNLINQLEENKNMNYWFWAIVGRIQIAKKVGIEELSESHMPTIFEYIGDCTILTTLYNELYLYNQTAALKYYNQYNTSYSRYTNTKLESLLSTPVKYRSRIHMTPPRMWTNDPNGLIYKNKEYHLFYQYNPWGNIWGHMSWGHAVSQDMFTWYHVPVGIYEDHGWMIFSGSAIQAPNTSLTPQPDPAGNYSDMWAYYTGFEVNTETHIQDQRIAFGYNRGRWFSNYMHNPILDQDSTHFRDPQVFKYINKWVMTTTMGISKYVQFYTSKDMITWTKLSTFGDANTGVLGAMQWECPILVHVPYIDDNTKSEWILKVSMSTNAPNGGSGSQYFIGNFDGTSFTNANPKSTVLFTEYGMDFYAAQTYNGLPLVQGERREIWIGWMVNWKYAAEVPSSPFRGQMTIPRELNVVEDNGSIRLLQNPAREIINLRYDDPYKLVDIPLTGGLFPLTDFPKGGSWDIELIFTLNTSGNPLKFGLWVYQKDSIDQETIIGYDPLNSQLYIDRTKSGYVDFNDLFPGVHRAPCDLVGNQLHLRVILDVCSVEVFAQGGRVAITDLLFPKDYDTVFSLFADGGGVMLNMLTAYLLKPSDY